MGIFSAGASRRDANNQIPGTTISLAQCDDEYIPYNKNGNILTLDRNGISDSYFDLIKIDQLNYEYANKNSNLLVKVTVDSQNLAGFKKGKTNRCRTKSKIQRS